MRTPCLAFVSCQLHRRRAPSLIGAVLGVGGMGGMGAMGGMEIQTVYHLAARRGLLKRRWRFGHRDAG